MYIPYSHNVEYPRPTTEETLRLPIRAEIFHVVWIGDMTTRKKNLSKTEFLFIEQDHTSKLVFA